MCVCVGGEQMNLCGMLKFSLYMDVFDIHATYKTCHFVNTCRRSAACPGNYKAIIHDNFTIWGKIKGER